MPESTNHAATRRRRMADDAVLVDAASAYDLAGPRYLVYADGTCADAAASDGGAPPPLEFTSRYSHADRQIWGRIDAVLADLAASGCGTLRILDAGCGPGTWLLRVVRRAADLGFAQIEAIGFDISGEMIALARQAAAGLQRPGLVLAFSQADVTRRLDCGDGAFDLCLCLYGVLNHIPRGTVQAVAAELARVTSGTLFVTVRTVGSLPTIYIDEVEQAAAWHQDNSLDRLEIAMRDGTRVSFVSHLFSARELEALFADRLRAMEVAGLDLFHSRFAPHPHWNPAIGDEGEFEHDLDELERRYARSRHFLDRASHILLTGRSH